MRPTGVPVHHLAGGAWYHQQPGDTLTDEDPGDLTTEFFESNPWRALWARRGLVAYRRRRGRLYVAPAPPPADPPG